MAARGDLFGEGPRACPFVALDNDRDRRSDAPDYRHRCYAEPTPQPRAIAHQEAYCLSPGFAACPIFQDWASRAAARPVPVPTGYQGRDAAPPAAAATGLAAGAAAQMLNQDAGPAEGPVDADAASPMDLAPEQEPASAPESVPAPESVLEPEPEPESAWAPEPEVEAESQVDEQLGAFDEPEAVAPPPPIDPAPPLPPFAPLAVTDDYPDDIPATPPPYQPSDIDDIPDVPPFLADRPPTAPLAAGAAAYAADDYDEPLPRSSVGRAPSVDRVRREDVVPSWEIDGRYGAQPGGDPPERGGSSNNLLTAVAVILILALGVAGVIFLPGLLAGGPSRTAAPSGSTRPTSSASLQPSTAPTESSAPTATPTPAEPTATPAPTPSPRTYRIKSGDTLARIARRNDITVADIIAANPEISDPNDIFVGQIIIIPQPLPTAQ